MSATNLQANAIIAFKMKNLGVLRQAAGAMKRVTQMGNAVGRTARRMSGGTVGNASAGYAAYGFLQSELRFQEAMNRTQAVLNITDEKAFKPHRDLVVDLAKKYPATSAEIAKGASELAMAGMSIKQVNEVLEATVQGALASGESIKTVGMGVTDVVMGLGMALTKGNFLKINNVLAAAATSYAQDYTQFLAGFSKTAPLARMLGLSVENLAGALGILADAGFKAQKGGTAFRTSMINMASPSKKALAFLQQYGIDIAKFQKKVDTFQLSGANGGKMLSQYLADSLNIDTAGLQNILKPILSNKRLLKDIPELKRRLGRAIAGALNTNDPQNAKLIGETVSRFVKSGFKQVDVMGLMRELARVGFDENVTAMKDLFGKRFTAQMAAVINSLRDGTFDAKMATFLPRVENAVKRFAGILMKGLPGALRELGGAFDGFLRSLGNSGAMGVAVDMLRQLKTALNKMSEFDPKLLKDITVALMTLGGVGAAGLVLSGVINPLGLLASALIFATYAWDKWSDKIYEGGDRVPGMASRIGAGLDSIRDKIRDFGSQQFGFQNFDEVKSYFQRWWDWFEDGWNNLVHRVQAQIRKIGDAAKALTNLDFNAASKAINRSTEGQGPIPNAAARELRGLLPSTPLVTPSNPNWPLLGQEKSRLGQFSPGVPLIRDMPGGTQRVDVTGRVDATVTGEATVTSRVEVTVKGDGKVTRTEPGQAKMPLKTGKSLPTATNPKAP